VSNQLYFYWPEEAGALYGTDIVFKLVSSEKYNALAYLPQTGWVAMRYGWAYTYDEACFIEDHAKLSAGVWKVVGREIKTSS